MNPKPFGEWTRVERSNWKRSIRSRRLRRRLLVVSGVAIMAFAILFSLASLRPPSMGGGSDVVAQVPQDETLRLTVPRMERVKDIPVYTAAPDNAAALDAGAIHVEGTGFPWENDANVYIAGHRLGYPNTGSFLVFYDIHKLANGDRVVLRDSDGKKYVYEVFKEVVVAPDEISVTEPVAGKNVVSLQACTLPDYSKRLIVQAELVNVVEEPVQASSGEPNARSRHF